MLSLPLRQIQGIWLAALIFALFCIVFSETNHLEYESTLDWRNWTAAFLALWMVVSGFSFRRRLLLRASAAFEGNDSIDANKKWLVAQLSSIMVSVSLVAWGLVARIVFGSPRWYTFIFYSAGILLLLLQRPQKLKPVTT